MAFIEVYKSCFMFLFDAPFVDFNESHRGIGGGGILYYIQAHNWIGFKQLLYKTTDSAQSKFKPFNTLY